MPDMADSAALWLLSLIVFAPVIGAILLAFLPSDKHDVLRLVTLATTGVVVALTIFGLLVAEDTKFDPAQGTMQDVFNVAWIPSFDIYYFMGLDGINFPLVALTAVISFLSMAASWSITKHVKAYCILFLLLETGMLGVFMALDFFLFYVFWEVMLLPMYFLIGVWGGPRKEYAALKFFLYTLVGSVLMLIAILMLYFASDVRGLMVAAFDPQHKNPVDLESLHIARGTYERMGIGATGVDPAANEDDIRARNNARIALLRKDSNTDQPLKIEFQEAATVSTAFDSASNTLTVNIVTDTTTAAQVRDAINTNVESSPVVAAVPVGEDGSGVVKTSDSFVMPRYQQGPVHTFNILALAAIGQHTTQFDTHFAKGTWLEGPWFQGTWFEGNWFDQSLQWWAFLLLLIGFIIKVPSVPFHTWLPDAHVEAPTPISMILAGVLLKMGGYGIIRICYPICPHGGYDLAYLVCLLGVVSMVYGAFAALAQKDFKRMVAYSSVSHMGYVLLGLGVWSATMSTGYNTYYWDMGVKGAMFQMIGHGISSPGMFFMVGIIYDRVHHRNLNEFGGLFGRMPFYTAMAMGIFFAGLGLPGLCGFIGEVFVVLSVWKYSMPLAIISAAVVVLTAAYILWALQRVYLGAEYKGPHGEHLHEANLREKAIGVTLLIGCILFGIFPYQLVLKYMDATIDRQVNQLTAWTKNVKEADMPPSAVANRDESETETPIAAPKVSLNQ
jgi:NADH:ubiquinone oxidoreductase subunit 4 (subunit M)